MTTQALMNWCVELVPYGEDAVVLLPDELLAVTGWAAGDELEWDIHDRRLILTRRAAPKASSAAPELR